MGNELILNELGCEVYMTDKTHEGLSEIKEMACKVSDIRDIAEPVSNKEFGDLTITVDISFDVYDKLKTLLEKEHLELSAVIEGIIKNKYKNFKPSDIANNFKTVVNGELYQIIRYHKQDDVEYILMIGEYKQTVVFDLGMTIVKIEPTPDYKPKRFVQIDGRHVEVARLTKEIESIMKKIIR